MVDHIHQERIWCPWNQCGSVYLWCRIWNSHTSGASHHRDTREPPLEQRPNLDQAGNPIEKHTNLLKHGYIILVKNLPFSLGRKVRIWNSAFKHIAWSTSLSPREDRWHRSGTVRFHTLSLPQKLALAFLRPGTEATTMPATVVA